MQTQTAQQPLNERLIEGDRTIFLGPAVLVASATERGAWHHVEGGQCDCKGFYYRGNCRHIRVALIAHEIDRAEATAAALPTPFAAPTRTTCPRCNKRPVAVLNAKPLRTCNICLVAVD